MIFPKHLVVLLLAMISIPLSAQITQSVFIDVGGIGPSGFVCSPATLGMSGPEDIDQMYDCSFPLLIGIPGLTAGPYSFIAPLIPTGMTLTNLEVILHNQICSSDITISLESEMLMLMVAKPCDLVVTDCPNTTSRTSTSFDCFSTPPSGINFGAMNQFDVMASLTGDGGICLTHAEIIFTFENCCNPSKPEFIQNLQTQTIRI